MTVKTAKLAAAAAAVSMLVGACGGSQAGDDSSTSSTTEPQAITSTSPTTLAPTTSTTVAPTTTTTAPPDPAELREEFLSDLDDAGWVTYEDSVIGWSVRYPPDWTVVVEEHGDQLMLESADGQGFLSISAALDAVDSETTFDYLSGNVDFAVNEGTLRPPSDQNWFWLDHDFDEMEGPLDIQGMETSLGIDGSGNPLPEDLISPVWWYGYYDPDARPDYGYILLTIGISPVMFQLADDIVLSFEPPASR